MSNHPFHTDRTREKGGDGTLLTCAKLFICPEYGNPFNMLIPGMPMLSILYPPTPTPTPNPLYAPPALAGPALFWLAKPAPGLICIWLAMPLAPVAVLMLSEGVV